MLILLGQQSEFRPRLGPDGSDAHLRELFRHVRIETIAGAGHMLHHERPEEVARLIQEFLRGP
jgi:pimeloyl-ACP methyl ester carboxylesterase